MALELTSPAFAHNTLIPAQYTCDGEDISPPLHWHHVPSGALSLTLIMDDPDAPRGTWVHWVIYDIPAASSGLPESVSPTEAFSGGTQGTNSWPRLGYGGPCPPSGAHRYFFKLYALDTRLNLPPGATKSDVLHAMSGHVLDEAVLVGLYQRH